MLNESTGGYAATARFIGKIASQDVSRQAVWQWWHRRGHTGFPEGRLVPRPAGRNPRREFDFNEIERWWREYTTTRTPKFRHYSEKVEAA
jgi:hypothetical protein